jgi:D-3-phosphoglycerate dehydrogenase
VAGTASPKNCQRVDLDAAGGAGIVVNNVPDNSITEVAAPTVALARALLRRVLDGDRSLTGGAWGIANLRPIRRISGLTFGLVGFGSIAGRVEAAIRPFGAAAERLTR